MLVTDIEKIEEMPLGRAEDLTKKHFNSFKVIKRIKPYTNARTAH